MSRIPMTYVGASLGALSTGALGQDLDSLFHLLVGIWRETSKNVRLCRSSTGEFCSPTGTSYASHLPSWLAGNCSKTFRV